jgi:hypothetical protein
MIAPHSTGHAYAADGDLLRVDLVSGRWVASRFAPDHVLRQEVFGTNEFVYRQFRRWLSASGRN